jgi:undecaprenyl phosphate N,N'-diacetylbacillosamine 1-phosphate transferase
MRKRLFDLIGALVLFIPAVIVTAILGLAVVIINRYRPYFFQARPGKDGKVFICLKLNTLRPPKDESDINDKAKDKLRATRFGMWLRNRGLDELPQVMNILVGQMSFVGPRPLLEKNYAKIELENPSMAAEIAAWRQSRQLVRPGLSGWHQIHSLGRGIIRYDMAYLADPSRVKQSLVIKKSIIILIVGKNRYFKVN